MSYKDFSVGCVYWQDSKFPQGLRNVRPKIDKLYFRGNMNALSGENVAIVGSRKMTRYGAEVVDRLVSSFVSNDVATVSGFMYGVDTEVHRKTVEYGGKTVAVFGCGLDVVYPSENVKLYEEILEAGGVVVSEYEPDSKPHLWKFPQRNRIVVGLSSLGVIVVEGAEKSGSLVTAELSLKQGKKLYAVPGPVTSSVSFGTNKLISDGKAQLLHDPSQIIGKKKQKMSGTAELSDEERQVWDLLEREELSIDEIVVMSDMDVTRVSQIVTEMSLKGYVSETNGKLSLAVEFKML